MANHLNPLQKELLVHRYKSNPGVKIPDFCRANNISDSAFRKWLKQYEEAGLAGLSRADKELKDMFPEGVSMSEEALRREILRLRIENERLKKNYMVKKTESGETVFVRLSPKSSK